MVFVTILSKEGSYRLVSNNRGRNFVQFEKIGRTGKLRNEFKAYLTTPDALICVENLYNFLLAKRHPLSPNFRLVKPAILSDKAEAVDLFDEIIALIIEVHRFEKELF
ncbi:MAG: hypothetical protein HQK89_00095 [Nitrospirae bacterium]|nr:hypothetical protein [Nitrospirota bacterium]